MDDFDKELEKYIQEHPEQAGKFQQAQEDFSQITQPLAELMRDLEEQAQSCNVVFEPLKNPLERLEHNLATLNKVMTQRRQGLILLGVDGGKLTKAGEIFKNKIPRNLALLFAIIDYAISLKADSGNEDLTLKDIANTITNGGALLDSAYKEDLARIFAEYNVLPRLEGASVERVAVPNNKLANSLTKLETRHFNGIAFPIKTIKEIKTNVALEFNNEQIKALLPNNITEYDRQIYNIVTSIYLDLRKQGKQKIYFSDRMIFKILAGQTTHKTFAAPETLKTIRTSVEKLSSIRISINAKEEINFYNKGKETPKFEFQQNLLYTKATTMTVRGYNITAWELLDVPVLYDYARLCGRDDDKAEIQTYPVIWRKVPALSHTPRNDEIIGYLLNQIQTIEYNLQKHKPAIKRYKQDIAKGKKRKKPTLEYKNIISLNTVYEHLNIDVSNRKATLSVRDSIEKCLKYWQSVGLFNSYKYEKKGRKIEKIVIDEINP